MARVITVSLSDISLMHVAAREYGSPLYWYTIAQANRLADCSINTVMTLVLPSVVGLTADGLATP